MIDLSKSREFFNPCDVKDRIHIIGCGSVGGQIAEKLVRFGLTKITLYDFDTVESHNLANQIFRAKDVGRLKTEALKDILLEVNPDASSDIKLKNNGWQGETISGIVFLCVDSIELRKKIVEQHFNNATIKAMFDVRTLLTGAQHYAARWNDLHQKKALLASMQFSDADAEESVPVSACGVTLGVKPTVDGITSFAVANFVNFANGKEIRKYMGIDFFDPFIESYK